MGQKCAHQQKRLQEVARIPVIHGERKCAARTIDVDNDLVESAAAVAEQCHPEVVERERLHLIEQFRVADTPRNKYPLHAVSRVVRFPENFP